MEQHKLLGRLHWKDLVIGGLALLVLALGGLLARERLAVAGRGEPEAAEGEPVTVFDVVLDREQRRYIDLLFDRPLGAGRTGDILVRPPVTLSPSIGGVWRWRTESILRFESSDRLPIATEVTLSLIEDRLLAEGQYLTGPREHKVQTDRFVVEAVEVAEEPVVAGPPRVLLRGNVRFNYPVEPEELATRVRLIDPLAGSGEPIAVELETGWRSEVIGFRAGPVPKDAAERNLRLVIDRDLTPYGGNVQLADDFAHEIPIGSTERLAVRSIEVEAGEKSSVVRVELSSPVTAGVAEPYVELDPAVDFRLSAAANELILTGALRPGSNYRLTLKEGLPARDEAVLPETHEAELRVPHLEPRLDFASDGIFLSRAGLGNLTLESMNVDQATLRIDRVYLNNVFSLASTRGLSRGGRTYYANTLRNGLGGRVASVELDIEAVPDRSATTIVSVEPWIDAGGPGLYRLILQQPGRYEAAERWLLLTDLGVVAKQGDDGLLAWITSSRDLSAAGGATVTLISDRNQTLARGRTDARGLWRSGELPEASEAVGPGRPYLLTVEKGDDFTFLLLDQMGIDTTGLDVAGARRSTGGYTAFLYGERDLYRPGETLEGVALVRNERLEAPPAMPMVLRHRDPEGRERGQQTLTLGAAGAAEFELEVPAWALTGRHSLELEIGGDVVGQYLYQVEEFVPDRIKVEVEAEDAGVEPGEELAYGVAASYLFGPPAAALPFETRVELRDATFAPPGFEAFTFRDGEREFERREVHASTGTLDAGGRAEVRTTLPDPAAVPSTLEAILTARVSEQGGRGVTASARVRVHPYSIYIGLRRTAEGYAEPGSDAVFEYVAVGTDGRERASGSLRAELYKDRWQTVLRRTPSGNYRYESRRDAELVDTRAISAGDARGELAFRIPDYGSYRVKIADTETSAAAEVHFYASGWGFSPWALENPARVELELDREEYRPGDTAVVLVKAPFPGKLLLAVELDRVRYTSIHALDGNTARIELPVRGEWRPNAYVTATLVRASRDLDPDGVGRAFGATPIRVDRGTNRLEVGIDSPGTVRSESPLAIEVTTAPGAAVTVAAVDEGILQLVSQQTPDPFEHFYRKLALGVGSFDTYSLLLPEVGGAVEPGGGEAGTGLAQFVRTEGIRRVEPVAFWSGVVEADGAGRARVEFAVPEFQGALRVMAVAADGRRFGSGDLLVRVRDPIVVLPTFPRVLSIEERAEIPVTVRNDTAGAGDFEVALGVEGEAAVDGEATRTVALERGAEATVYFALRTGAALGDVRLTVVATGNGERGKASGAVPIRADLPYQTERAFGSVVDTETEWAQDGSGWARPGTVSRSLRLGRFPLVQFAGRLDELLRYPYGCLEQTTSTVFPLIYLDDLARELAPELLDRPGFAPELMVAAGIRRVASFQLHSGGFSLWTGGRQPHLWGTIHATHFLVEARRAGYAVDAGLLERALGFIGREVRARASYESYAELQRTAYSLFVLARAGRTDLATMDFLRERHLDSLKPESRGLLAAAYAADGNLRAVSELTAQIGDLERVERQTGGNFESTLRNRALLLLAMLESQPDSPKVAALVERLTREASATESWNTQESGFVLLALGQLAKRQAERPPFSGTVFVGERPLGELAGTTASFTGITEPGPLRVEMAPGYEAGSAFFSLLVRGIPTDDAFEPGRQGLELERDYLDREGAPLDLESVEQGDLIVARIRVRSVSGPVENVVVQNLLPSGVEVENPRLDTTESLPWAAPEGGPPAYLDLRDDRVLLFVDLAPNRWQTHYALLRAVTPGEFRLPPAQAEAMYDPALRATTGRGQLRVEVPSGR